MRIAITGATGFLGPYLVTHLANRGHVCRCWYRPSSLRSGLSSIPQNQLEWVIGELGNEQASRTLVTGCDAVVHAALYRHGVHFTGGEGDVVEFVRTNVVGTLQLIEAARVTGVPRFVFISTCAVHDVILEDRPLDEKHPLWPKSHYGAHKAALEKFVHAYGFGAGYDICALRPTGIYGLAHPPEESRWFDLVRAVAGGQDVACQGGGKEVHALDVARSVEILLEAEGIAGQAYNCYDRYISEYDVAELAKKLTGSSSRIRGEPGHPKHQIVTDKLRALGMTFGGQALLESTIKQMLSAVGNQ
jgi:nucleoside-diphosphate-sugar epimerase